MCVCVLFFFLDQASLPFSEESVFLQADESCHPEFLEGKSSMSLPPALPMDVTPDAPPGLDADAQETVGHLSGGVEAPMPPKTDSSDKSAQELIDETKEA